MKTIVGLYYDLDRAHKAIQELIDSGYQRENISLVTSQAMDEYGVTGGSHAETADVAGEAAKGAGVGAALGGLAGLVVGAAALAIPGIGPLVAAGPLAAVLGGASMGAATGGLVGALGGTGIPEADAQMYEEGVREGGVLVAVQTGDERAPGALDIMNSHHPIDIRERSGKLSTAGAHSQRDIQERAEPGQVKVPQAKDMREYRAESGASDDTNRYRGESSEVGDKENQTFVHRPAMENTDQPNQERPGANRYRTEPDSTNDKAKEPSPGEEDMPGYRSGEHTMPDERTVSDQMARDMGASRQWGKYSQQAPPAEPTMGAAYQPDQPHMDVERRQHTPQPEHEAQGKDREPKHERTRSSAKMPDFHEYYDKHLKGSGGAYEDYEPAYRFGYDLFNSDKYHDHDWSQSETVVHQEWQRQHPGETWSYYKEAIRAGWNAARAQRREHA